MKVKNSTTGETTKLQKGKGQTETLARFKALSCMRMAVQQAVMCESKMGKLPDCYKWNVDASTMIIEDQGKGATMYRVVSCDEAETWERKLLKDPLASLRFQQGLDMGLKWMHLANGNGDFGLMVLIIAVPGMPIGRYFYAEVQGLVFGEDSTKVGRVYFAASRCMKGLPDEPQATVDNERRNCNPWSHYFQVPFLNDIKKYADSYAIIDPATDHPFVSVCTIDGESCVNRELMAPEVFEKLAEHNIELVKNRPSGTAYDNANDASDNFRDKNTGLKHVVQNNIDTSNKFLEAKLDKAFKDMRAAFPSVTMSAAHQKQAVVGCSRFVWVCRSKYVTSEKAIIGFRRTMQVRSPDKDLLRPIFGCEESTVDSFRMMRHLCHTKFSDAEQDNIHLHFPEMMQLQRLNGRVTNEDMDRLQICKLPDDEHKDRDGLCLAQQGPVDLTHNETRQREIVYASRKETAAKEKRLSNARALIDRSTKKVAVAAESAREKVRIKGLSKEEKKTDPACMAKAIDAKEKRDKLAAKKVKDTQALEEAEAIDAEANGMLV